MDNVFNISFSVSLLLFVINFESDICGPLDTLLIHVDTYNSTDFDSDTISAYESDDNYSVTSDKDDGTHGRHIVEIRYLGEQLKKGWLLCGEILHLSSFIGNKRFGLGMVKW